MTKKAVEREVKLIQYHLAFFNEFLPLNNNNKL